MNAEGKDVETEHRQATLAELRDQETRLPALLMAAALKGDVFAAELLLARAKALPLLVRAAELQVAEADGHRRRAEYAAKVADLQADLQRRHEATLVAQQAWVQAEAYLREQTPNNPPLYGPAREAFDRAEQEREDAAKARIAAADRLREAQNAGEIFVSREDVEAEVAAGVRQLLGLPTTYKFDSH